MFTLAGVPIKQVSGQDVSVHVGCFTFDYMLANAKDPENGPRYSATGMAASLLSNRVSTFFNLTGPSITIDTACSSSLVALDLACRSIQQGESSMVRLTSNLFSIRPLNINLHYFDPVINKHAGDCCRQQPPVHT